MYRILLRSRSSARNHLYNYILTTSVRARSLSGNAYPSDGPGTAAGEPEISVASPAIGKQEDVVDVHQLEISGPATNFQKLKSHSSYSTYDNTTRPSSSELNNVDLFLASLRAAGKEPTVEDIERCRPLLHASEHSPEYAKEYNALTDRLCRTFSKAQLRNFTLAYNFDYIWSRPGRRKVEYAQAIMEKQWGWPNLKEIERHQRDITEVVIRTFPVTASELFLLLGPDGSTLLQMSLHYNVHISVTPKPLSLQVEGLRGSLKEIETLITLKKKAIVERTIELPSKNPIRLDLLQRISRLAGAFMENVGLKGKVRIRANTDMELEGAERLAIRAAAYENHTSGISPFCHVSSNEDDSQVKAYSFFPFLPQRSLPWTMKMGTAFRARQINGWSNQFMGQDIQSIPLSPKMLLLNQQGNRGTLNDMILAKLPALQSTEKRRTFTIYTGHVLFTSGSTSRNSELDTPLSGSWDCTTFLNWMRKTTWQRTFVPSLPLQLHNTIPSRHEIIHQVLYRSSPVLQHDAEEKIELPSSYTKSIKLEVILNKPETSAVPEKPRTRTDKSSENINVTRGSLHFSLEEEETEYLAKDFNNPDFATKTHSHSHTRDDEIPDVEADILCHKSEQLELELLLPDRPMDLKLLIQDYSITQAEEMPPELKNYISDLSSYLKGDILNQPNPPIYLTDTGDKYILETNTSLRRSTETGTTQTNDLIVLNTAHVDLPLQIVTENILDLETDQRSTTCSITCTDLEPEESWESFFIQGSKLTDWSNYSKSDVIF